MTVCSACNNYEYTENKVEKFEAYSDKKEGLRNYHYVHCNKCGCNFVTQELAIKNNKEKNEFLKGS